MRAAPPEGGVNDAWFVACQQLVYSSRPKWFVRGTLVASTGPVTASPWSSGTPTENTPIVDPMLGTNCTLLVPLAGPDHLGFLPIAVGAAAAWTLPLPENLPAMTLHFQDWVLELANNRLWGTRRRSVPLTK